MGTGNLMGIKEKKTPEKVEEWDTVTTDHKEIAERLIDTL